MPLEEQVGGEAERAGDEQIRDETVLRALRIQLEQRTRLAR